MARDSDARVFCYTNATICKAEQKDEILQFAPKWKDRHGGYLWELVFDSPLTAYDDLARLDRMDIGFLTLRCRTKNVIAAVAARAAKKWMRIRLTNVRRRYRRPCATEDKVILPGFGARAAPDRGAGSGRQEAGLADHQPVRVVRSGPG